MKILGFVHLHLHTEYSLLNGACRLKNLVKYVKKIGQSAVAITDYCNLFGAVKFFCECEQQNIKPIIGCEILVKGCQNGFEEGPLAVEKFKLVVLCENNTGYRNLVKIVSFLNSGGDSSEAVAVDFEFFKNHSSGLIILSGGLDGEIFWGYSNFGFDYAKQIAVSYSEFLGKNNFFLQLQNHGLIEEQNLIDCFKKIARELELELVATNDVHYVEQADAQTQKILSCIKFSETLNQKSNHDLPNNEFYLKTEVQMKSLFLDCKQAIENAEKIANRCCFNFKFGEVKTLKFNTNISKSNEKLLLKKAKQGLFKKYGNKPEKVVLNRFNYEFSIIAKMGFVDYFLIVCDYVNYARQNSIATGPGRGSGAGSLLAFCLNITLIDPIKYGLSFERFLNLGRKKMPDFDVDFCNERRQEVIDYVIKKYGQDKVARIITFGTLAASAAVRDVAKILGANLKLSNLMSKLITRAKLIANKYKISLKDALNKSDELKSLLENNRVACLIFKFACYVEGMPRNTSTHASAVVFSYDGLNSYIPLIRHGNVILTQYDMDDVSKLGFLKMDFLGLRNLTVIGKCEKLIRENSSNFNIEHISLSDKRTFDLLCRGESIGVFQLESNFVHDILFRVQPKKLEDIMIVMTLYRPGPSRFIDLYVKNRRAPKKIKYLNEKMKKILKSTCGIIIYQEQVMQIFRDIAGYSFERIDLIREAISKKNLKLIEQECKLFLAGAKRSEVDDADAMEIYETLTNFSAYTFNKSHAAAYSLIAYQTAFLKANYATQYFTCLLNSVLFGDRNKLQIYLNECIKLKICVNPVNVNTSEVEFEVINEGEIAFSFLAIKGIGRNLAEQIVNERRNGLFSSTKNFFERIGGKNLTKIAANSLIENGAFNEFTDRSNKNLSFAKNFISYGFDAKIKSSGQLSLFNGQADEKIMNKKVEFVAEVRGKKQILFKNNKKIFILNLFGEFKSFNCLVFDNLVQNLENDLNLNDFFVVGCTKIMRLNKQFLVAKNVVCLNQLKQDDLILVLKLRTETTKNLNKLKTLVKKNPGLSSVLFVFDNNKKYFRKKGFNKIRISPNLLNEIRTIFGKDSIKILYKKIESLN